uniref:protein-serine/threonine phosphatase n=1 Tax=Aegilops tauschii TaxID=37682 RepID=M8CAR3_AEGTA
MKPLLQSRPDFHNCAPPTWRAKDVGGNDTYGITGIPPTVGGRGVVQRAGLVASTKIVYPDPNPSPVRLGPPFIIKRGRHSGTQEVERCLPSLGSKVVDGVRTLGLKGGVLCWRWASCPGKALAGELLTGVVPYTDLRAEAQAHTILEMTYTEQQLTSAVVSQGLRPALALPESGSPPSLLSLIQRSWDSDPERRPSFGDIIEELNVIQKHLVTYSCPLSSGSVNLSRNSKAEVHHYQEALNWFNQGELLTKKANKLDYAVNPWSSSFDQSSVSVYRPTLSWGSFATCGRRETMEDTHFMLTCLSEEKDVHSFGIFDGHRGAAAAEFSVRAVPGFLKQFGHTASPIDALAEAFVRSDTAFREELIAHQKSKRIIQKDWHPGCTAVTALIDHVASCPKERERVIKEGAEVRWQIDTWRVGAAALQKHLLKHI